MNSQATNPKPSGLAGVVAGTTAIATVGKEGSGLTYRGYKIEDLAENARFEEVAWLLLHDDLPTQAELTEFEVRLKEKLVPLVKAGKLIGVGNISFRGRTKDEIFKDGFWIICMTNNNARFFFKNVCSSYFFC